MTCDRTNQKWVQADLHWRQSVFVSETKCVCVCVWNVHMHLWIWTCVWLVPFPPLRSQYQCCSHSGCRDPVAALNLPAALHSLPSPQLFNYPGLLIHPGTHYSGSSGKGPGNDWLLLLFGSYGTSQHWDSIKPWTLAMLLNNTKLTNQTDSYLQ